MLDSIIDAKMLGLVHDVGPGNYHGEERFECLKKCQVSCAAVVYHVSHIHPKKVKETNMVLNSPKKVTYHVSTSHKDCRCITVSAICQVDRDWRLL